MADRESLEVVAARDWGLGARRACVFGRGPSREMKGGGITSMDIDDPDEGPTQASRADWGAVWSAWNQLHRENAAELDVLGVVAAPSARVPSSSSSSPIDVMCDLVWRHGPAGTFASALVFKPVLTRIAKHLSSTCDAHADALDLLCVTSALILLAELHPAVKTIARRHCSRHELDFGVPGKATGDARGEWLLDAELAKAGYRAARLVRKALSAFPWNWKSYIELVRSEDKCAKWFALNACSLLFGLPRDTRRLQLNRYYTIHERLQHYLGWRLEQRMVSGVRSRVLYSDSAIQAQVWSLTRELFIPNNLDAATISGGGRPEEGHTYVKTATCCDTYAYVLASLDQNRPTILWGPSGCGKSALMKSLKRLRHQDDMLTVHMHKSMDSRSLVGTYVCTSQAGEFQWKQGPLTIAALKGKWLCIEEINAAPQEALALLASVAESGLISVPGRGLLRAKPGFMIFGLCTQETGSTASLSYCDKHLLRRVWAYHEVPMHSVEESVDIALRLYPSLRCISSNLSSLFSFLTRIVQKGLKDDAEIQQLIRSAGLTAGEVISNLRCPFNLRHLLQLCERLVRCHSEWAAGSTEIAPESLRKMAFYHTVDTFCGGIRQEEFGRKFSSIFLQFWGLSSYHKDEYEVYKPVLDIGKTELSIGRASLPKVLGAGSGTGQDSGGVPFVATAHSLRLLEKTAISIQTEEPILLVGETGIGKTACIQHLSKITGSDLLVLNMNQQSDSSDLVGSFRPVESHLLLMPLLVSFQSLISKTWPTGNNQDFFRRLHSYAHKKKWMKLIHGFKLALQKLTKSDTLLDIDTVQYLSSYLTDNSSASPSVAKRAKIESKAGLTQEVQKGWRGFVDELSKVEAQVLSDVSTGKASKAHFSFSFIEGILVQAMREGKWLLIDEINLAPSEALEKLFAVLDSKTGTFSLTERGDTETIQRHPGFRLFAAMNPGTDAGKKELPANLRSRFTEFYVPESLAREDLEHIVRFAFKSMSVDNAPTAALVDFYLHAKQQSKERLYDCAGQKPHYSLRTLCRTLEYILKAVPIYGMNKSTKDGIFMAFFTQLDKESRAFLNQYLHSKLSSAFTDEYHERALDSSGSFVQFESFFLKKGPVEVKTEDDPEFAKYIVTKSVKQRLRDVARAIYYHKSPILLQGPTSAGKTSLIKHIASATGYKCIRINNHANTDVQEYTGTYSTDKHGNIRFHEGPLVQALRMGYWVILDELNLAPSDVLEALNRLLDDNRELYVPEINETIKPHANFMLFATQNPAGAYGGRKTLSRAFRNRFIEIYVDDIPEQELPTILEKSCLIAESQAKRMVQSSKKLRQHRQKSAIFAGKHGYITPRDLLKWGNRSQRTTLQEMSDNGYTLLAERLRDSGEKVIVKNILQKEFKSTLKTESMYDDYVASLLREADGSGRLDSKISMGKSMQRLFALIHKCWRNGEPVLLVGETGCGKTTACQMLASLQQKYLHIYNCHQHSETSDFIGSYRPSRNTQLATEKFLLIARELTGDGHPVRDLCNDLDAVRAVADSDCSLVDMSKAFACIEDAFGKLPAEDSQKLFPKLETLRECHAEMRVPFEWVDGPLVTAMKNGDFILVDELSLAEDAVLERLNSVLEVGGSVTLSEKGSDEVEEIIPRDGFFLLATMNPGGDFGKRELSPALRNRFTEIWVPPIEDLDEIRSIISGRLPSGLVPDEVVDAMLEVWKFLFDSASESLEGQKKQFLSIRDLVAWADFITLKAKELGPALAFGHGAHLVFLDGFGVGTGNDFQIAALKEKSEDLVARLSRLSDKDLLTNPSAKVVVDDSTKWGIHPFFVAKGTEGSKQKAQSNYSMTTPTAMKNLWRILRAMQMPRALLLEGSPGVGKSSMIQNLALLTCNNLVRINLSEHTDMMDLLGAESPCDPSKNDGALFKWQDGPLLLAVKNGSWVLLDELNLAQQSVLEGLNALLDHRAEIFIPELNKTFNCSPTFKIFATQNPMNEGGGRKGLPKSFLNRFTKVYMESLTTDDFHHILHTQYDGLPQGLLRSILSFNDAVKRAVSERKIGQSGGPWDFNFRDVTRCIDIIFAICNNPESLSTILPSLALQKKYTGVVGDLHWRNMQVIAGKAIESVYMQRMRSMRDKQFLVEAFETEFGATKSDSLSIPEARISSTGLSVGLARIDCRKSSSAAEEFELDSLDVLHGLRTSLESVVHAVNNGWMCSFVGDWKSEGISIPTLISKITGHDLKVIRLTNCTDTSDLLGSFEQHNLEGDILAACKSLGEVTVRVCGPLMESEDLWRAAGLMHDMQKEVQGIENFAMACSGMKGEYLQSQLELMLQKLARIRDFVAGEVISDAEAGNMLENIIKSMEVVKDSAGKKQFSGFSWIDGPLVEAIKEGKWIMLEDANLCNPAVLDRLNPLLEGSNSYFMLNESTGSMERLTPHKDFRLFLAWDPSAGGEISRAMRNRGIEVFFMRQNAHVPAIHRIAEGCLGRNSAHLRNIVSSILTFFTRNGVRVQELSESLMADLFRLCAPGFDGAEDSTTSNTLCRRLASYFSVLQCGPSEPETDLDHRNFAVRYTLALDPAEKSEEESGDLSEVRPFINLLTTFFSRLNAFSNDLLEPDFLVLDADSACFLNLLSLGRGTNEVSHALTHFLYSARSVEDHSLRRAYVLEILPKLRLRDAATIRLLQAFTESRVPNELSTRMFDLGNRLKACLGGGQVMSERSSSKEESMSLVSQVDFLLEQLFSVDEHGMLQESLKAIQSPNVNITFSEHLSVFTYAVGLSGSDEATYLEDSVDVNPSFKHLRPLLNSIVSFEVTVSKGMPQIWTPNFKRVFASYQEQRRLLCLWMGEQKVTCVEKMDYFIYLLVGFKARVKMLMLGAPGISKTCPDYSSSISTLWDSVNILMHNMAGLNADFQYEVPLIYAAGRPLCIADASVLALIEQLGNVGRALTFHRGRLHLHEDSFVVSSFRKDVQKGLALIFLAAQDGGQGKLESAHQICGILEKKYAHLTVKSEGENLFSLESMEPEEHLNKILVSGVHLEAYNNMVGKGGEQAKDGDTRQLLFSWKAFQQLAANLQSLADLHNLMSEFHVLPLLLRLCNADKYSASDLNDARNALQRIALFAAGKNCRSPLDFVVHQQLLWLLDNDSSVDRNLLISQVHELSYNWFASLLRTCENVVFLVGNDDEQNMELSDTSLHDVLFHGHSNIVSKLISYSIPCILQHIYTDSLKDAEGVLHKELKSLQDVEASDCERCSLLEMLKQVFLCHQSSFDLKLEENLSCFEIIRSASGSRDVCACLDAMLRLCQTSPESHFSKLSLPVLQVLDAWKVGSEMPFHEVKQRNGLVWLGLGLLRIHLAAPPQGYDPALEPAHKANALEAELNESTKSVLTLVDQTQLSQYGESFQLQGVQGMLVKKIEQNEEKIAQFKRSAPVRSGHLSYQDLVRDVSGFLKQKLDVDQVLTIVNNCAQDPLAFDALSSLGKTSLLWGSGMQTKYASYADIIQPLNLGVFQLSYGISMMESAEAERKDSSKSLSKELVSLPRRDPAQLARAVKTFLEGSDLDVVDKHLQMIRILRCCLTASVDRLGVCKFSNEVWKLSNVLLGQYTHIWDIAKQKEDQELEKASALFKSTAKGNTDYMREFQRVVMDEDGNFEQDSFLEGEIRDNIKDSMEREFAYDVMISHWKATQAFKDEVNHLSGESGYLFTENDEAERVEDFLECYDTLSRFLESKDSYIHDSSEGVVNAHIMRTYLRQKSISESQSILRMRSPVQRFYARVEEIRKEWPDNELLAQLRDISARLLLLPSDTPIKRAMSGLELLLLRSLTWEESAASHVSVKKELESLAAIANGWRKDELRAMENLFQRNEQKHVKMASVGWLHLFEILKHFTSTKACKLNLSEILESIEEFVQTSPIGQFEIRLAIVKMFYMHLQVHTLLHAPASKRHTVLNCLSAMLQNLHSYYSQFLGLVRDDISSGTGVLSKELTDFIQLSKWEDINVYAMRNNIDKSNRTVLKLRHKHDELMRRGVKDILQAQSKKVGIAVLSDELSKQEVKESTFQRVVSGCMESCKLILELGRVGDQASISPSLLRKASKELKNSFQQGDKKKLAKLALKASKLCKPVVYGNTLSGYWFKLAESIDVSAYEVAHRATQLRGLDKPAKMQKQKAVSDLFKTLKNFGYSKTRKMISQQTVLLKYFKTPSSASLSDVCDCLLDREASDETRLLFAKAESYFYKCLATYQSLSSLGGDYHPDIQGSEFEYMVAYVQNLLNTCFQLRSLLELSALRSSTMGNLMDTLKSLAENSQNQETTGTRQPCEGKHVRKWLWKVSSVCSSACKILEDANLLLQNSSHTAEDGTGKELHSMLESAKECARQMEALLKPRFGKAQTMSEMIQLQKKGVTKRVAWNDVWPIFPSVDCVPAAIGIVDKLQELHKQLESCGKKLSSQGFSSMESAARTLGQELSSVPDVSESAVRQATNDKKYSTFSTALGNSFARATESILVWIEQLSLHRSKTGDEELEAQGDDWEALQANFATAKLSVLSGQMDSKHICQVEGSLLQLFKVLAANELRSEQDLCLIGNEIAGLHKLCEIACATHQHLTVQILTLLKASTKLAHICSSVFVGLCKDGYCTPPDQDSKHQDENGAFEEADGTGMGEGDGAKDVSDKIENEEQVEGLKGEDQGEDQDGQQPEEDTKGVEMGDDFEGNMFDIEEDETDDENNDDDGDEDQENLDQQMGDVDETFDAADERLWNDEDEESKNKNGEEQGAPIGGQTDDMMAAEEEDGEKEEGEDGDDADGAKEEEKQASDGEEDINEMEAEKEHGLHVEKEVKGEEEGDEMEDAENDGGDQDDGPETEGPEDNAEGDPAEEEKPEAGAEEQKEEDTAVVDLKQEEEEELGDQQQQEEEDDVVMQDQPGEYKEEPNDPEESDGEQEDRIEEDEPKVDPEAGLEEEEEGNEGPEGQPSRQDAAEDEAGVGGRQRGEDQENDFADAGRDDRMDADLSANPQPGAQSADQQSRSRQQRDNRESRERQGVNPHRKFGEAMERFKLDVSVTMDLEDTEGANEVPNPEDADEFGYDAGKEDREGGPEALGQTNEDRDDAPRLEEEEEDDDGDGEEGEAREEKTRVAREPKPVAERSAAEDRDLNQARDGEDGEKKEEAGGGPMDTSNSEEEEEEPVAGAEDGKGADEASAYDATVNVAAVDLGAEPSGLLESVPVQGEEALAAASEAADTEEGRARWLASSSSVESLVGELTEQLRLTLIPTQVSKMAGDYRTGKRLNIRKLIPYIASNFKKDKIWLRRTQPDKRKYQVLLAVDDSRSMVENGCEKFALDSVALLCNAMSRLEVGDLSILKFGGSQGVSELHPLGRPFDASSGVRIASSLQFDQESNVRDQPVLSLLREGLGVFRRSKHELSAFDRPEGLHQLFLIVADGRINEGDQLRSLVHDALAEGGLMIVFIVLDTSKNSLLDVQTVDFVNGVPVLRRYMDQGNFPFPFYTLVREIGSLPRCLAAVIKQWLELTAHQND